MALEEKRAWIMVVVSVCACAAYLTVVLLRAAHTPLAEVPYAAALLWSIGGAIAASIVLHIAADIATPKDSARTDVRDREIHRFGEHVGRWSVAAGGIAALVMALVELDHFWIANAVYLSFVLSAVLGSIARIAAYRRGFQSW
ncbi:hypothetical protein NI17_002005 [Thermobifida halotolerans]|uniref:Uncharacterized protein n=1 Tax=Thermobifida halotolerans TaxID=483545 RepID=A0A399G8S6_9ACTN|nr:hypothetical protein [Thermobifida halotolerans]UOE20052.1 hypothetical protein NI17_002005 [Thermobifida halotolerans]